MRDKPDNSAKNEGSVTTESNRWSFIRSSKEALSASSKAAEAAASSSSEAGEAVSDQDDNGVEGELTLDEVLFRQIGPS